MLIVLNDMTKQQQQQPEQQKEETKTTKYLCWSTKQYQRSHSSLYVGVGISAANRQWKNVLKSNIDKNNNSI